jgi:ribonuclease VapC
VTPVLDASALLALLYREPGHEQVADSLDGAVVSAVNWAEVLQKLAQRGHPAPTSAADGITSLGVQVVPFGRADAACAGLLWSVTRRAGLSLGDRACLAVAQRVPDGVAVTADRAWADLDLGVTVRLIR